MVACLVGTVAVMAGTVDGQEQPGVIECFVAARGETRELVVNPDECAVRTSPASTFKIPHALIALETGVVTPATVFKWDGTAYDFPSWRADHTVESAIRASVLPFFQRTAKAIGRERMAAQLGALAYSGDPFEGAGDFWVDGDLEVAPLEQLAFLQRFFAGTLPIARSHVTVVKDALRMPAGQVLLAAGPQPFVLDWPALVVRAKTGNTRVRGERVSWLVGAVEAGRTRHVFVARARSTGDLATTAGAEVARRGLNRLRQGGP